MAAIRSTCIPFRVTQKRARDTRWLPHLCWVLANSPDRTATRGWRPALGTLPSERIKEINCHRFLQPFSETRYIDLLLRAALGFQLASGGQQVPLESARLFRDCGVVGVASRPEERLDIGIVEAIDEAGLTDGALTVSFFDLSENPLKVTPRGLVLHGQPPSEDKYIGC